MAGEGLSGCEGRSGHRADLESQAKPKQALSPPELKLHLKINNTATCNGERAQWQEEGSMAGEFGGEPPSWTVAHCGTAPGALESAPNTLFYTAHAGKV